MTFKVRRKIVLNKEWGKGDWRKKEQNKKRVKNHLKDKKKNLKDPKGQDLLDQDKKKSYDLFSKH